MDFQGMISTATEHVQDADALHLPFHIVIPMPTWIPGFTKYVFIELLAFAIICAIFIPLARRIATGGAPKGKFWNFFEVMLVYLRDSVYRPALGHGGDRYIPLLWTLFFFILLCNLLGLVPWLGSPTASIAVTGALACFAFAAVLFSGFSHFGLVGFFRNLVPPMVGVPAILKYMLVPLMFGIELISLLIKHVILAIRLLANMFAGHLLLAVLLGFIGLVAGTWVLWIVVTPLSIAGQVAIMLLELFVAFLQAYVFTFLTAIFIGMASHSH